MLREVEIYRDGAWSSINIQLLNVGDKFRMFEPTGELVDGEWLVIETPICVDGVWGLNAELVEQ